MGRIFRFPQVSLRSLAAVVLVFASFAYGHAILLTAKPAMGASVTGPDIEVSLRFNSRVDAKRSKITLVHAGSEPVTLKIDDQSPADFLNSQVRGLTIGSYVLQWQVLAVDGHISRGEVPFRVQ